MTKNCVDDNGFFTSSKVGIIDEHTEQNDGNDKGYHTSIFAECSVVGKIIIDKKFTYFKMFFKITNN